MLRELLSSQTDEASAKYNDFIHELSHLKSGLDGHIVNLQVSIGQQTECATRLEQLKQDAGAELLKTHRALAATVSNISEQVASSNGPVADAPSQQDEQWPLKIGAIKAALARVDGTEQTVSKIGSDVESRLQTAASTVTQSIAVLSQSLVSFRTLNQEHSDTLNATFDLMQQEANACDQSARHLHQQLSQASLNELLDSFTSLNQQIAALLVNAFESRVMQTQDALIDLEDDLKSVFEVHVGKLLSTASEVMGSMANQLEGEFSRQVQNAFDQLLKDCATAFMSNLVESLATAQLGASTTASLSPVVPQLAVAKRAVSVINSFI